MRLRNKKTGQVGNFIINKDHFECVDLEYVPEYRNLAELNADWEDVPEEPNIYYFIDIHGQVKQMEDLSFDWQNKMSEIGNRFRTEEEAEKAVEKLKAWTRLKDKGFKPKGWDWEDDPSKIEIKFRCPDESCLSLFNIQDDLDLLFNSEVEDSK